MTDRDACVLLSSINRNYSFTEGQWWYYASGYVALEIRHRDPLPPGVVSI